MGTTKLLVVAAAVVLLATPSIAKDGNTTTRHGRRAPAAADRPAPKKSLSEVKRSIRIAVIPTDVRQKRYLTFGFDLDEQTGGVLPRRQIAGDAISDGP